jgi:hypothetical protein
MVSGVDSAKEKHHVPYKSSGKSNEMDVIGSGIKIRDQHIERADATEHAAGIA